MKINGRRTVLVVDGGGRASALAAAYLASPQISTVLATPGNDLLGFGSKKKVLTYPQIKTTNVEKIIEVCRKNKVDLVDVAQDDAVAAGLTDELLLEGFKVFGPTRAAGQIEWDKAWAREFMTQFRIPIPSYTICKSEKDGLAFLRKQKKGEWFIKASGLAAGKGVIYAKNNTEAKNLISEMKLFGASGKTFLIEEALIGEEFSSFALVDGKNFIIVGHAQDHKRAFDGDRGPNTGGMGCSSPPLAVTKKVEKQIKEIFKKTVEGLVELERPYRGIMYLGGMIDKNGKVHVIEYNARWGDPEVEVILPGILNDWYEVANFVASGKLKKVHIKKDNEYRIVVAATSRGYPGDYSKIIGKTIIGLDKLLKNKEIVVFGGNTKKAGKKLLAAGSRLFYVVSSGKNVLEARTKAYKALSSVSVPGNNLHYRTDIGYRDADRIS